MPSYPRDLSVAHALAHWRDGRAGGKARKGAGGKAADARAWLPPSQSALPPRDAEEAAGGERAWEGLGPCSALLFERAPSLSRAAPERTAVPPPPMGGALPPPQPLPPTRGSVTFRPSSGGPFAAAAPASGASSGFLRGFGSHALF